MSASSSGVAFSMSSVDAPTRSGNTTRPPSPNVNASGGVPVNTSSGVGRSTCVENVSALASTSRWKCMVAFGRPGRARREGQQRDVVGGGLDVGRTGATPASPGARDRRPRPRRRRRSGRCRGRTLRRSSRNRWSQSATSIFGDLVHRAELARTQQRHRRDHDGARLAARRTSRRPATGCSGRAAARGCPARPRARRRARGRPGWTSRAARRTSTARLSATAGTGGRRRAARWSGPAARRRS